MARPDQTQQWPGGRDFSGRDGHGSSSHRGGYTGGRTGGWGNHPPLHSVMQPPQPPPSRWSSHTPGRITTDAYAPTTESDAVLSRPAPQSQPPSTSEGWDADHKAVHGWERMTRTIAHYRRIEQIGEGTYGQVYRAQCLDTGRIVAMKKIRLHHGGYWGMPPTVIREIKILKRLRHPCMVEMLEVVSSKGVEHLDEEDEREDDRRRRRKEQADKDAMNISPNNTSDIASNIKKDVVSSSKKKGNSKADRVVDAREGYKGNLFLVLEYVSHDLTGLMDMAYRFTEVQAKCIFRQLLDVLAYMHEAKYVHRDIKSSNILIDSHFRVKLADFGLARCIEPPILDNANDRSSGQSQSGGQDFTNKVITLWYRPPELLLGATRYGSQVDVWSAGCILYELLLGKPLFAGKTEMEQLRLIFELIGTPTETSWEGFTDLKLIRTKEVVIEKRRKPKLRAKYGTKITGPAMNLLEKLLELDPSKRLTASRALESRYFLSEPRAPDQPEQLGSIVLGDGNEGNFHEFQTKKRRREAKVIAEKAKEEARARGEDETGVTAAYDEAYRHHMKGAAAEKAAEIAAKAEKDLREAEALKLQEKERISPSRKRTNERDMMVEGDDYRKSEKEDERSHRSRDKKDRKRHRSDVDDRKRHRDSSSKADHRSSSSSKRERRDEDRKRSSRDRDRHHRHHHRGTKEDDGERSTERSSSRHHKHDIVEEVVDTKKEKPDETKTEKPEPKTKMEIDVPASKDVKDLSKTATEPLKTDHVDGYKTAENAQKNDDTLDKPPGGREDSKNASKSDVDKEKSEKPRSSDSRRHTNGSSSRSSKHRSGSRERGSTSDRRSSRDDRGRDHGGRSGTMMEQPPRGPSSHPQGRDPSMMEDRRGWERGPDFRSRTNFDSRGADRGRESWRDEPSNGDHAGMGDRGPQPRHQSHPGDFDRDRRRPDHARQAGGGPPPDQSWGGGHFGGGRGPGAPPSQQWRGPGPRGSRDGGRGGFRGDSRPGGDRQGDRFGGRSGGGHHRDR